MFKSNRNPQFRSSFSETQFYNKYSHEGAETFHELACTLVEDVCQTNLNKEEELRSGTWVFELDNGKATVVKSMNENKPQDDTRADGPKAKSRQKRRTQTKEA